MMSLPGSASPLLLVAVCRLALTYPIAIHERLRDVLFHETSVQARVYMPAPGADRAIPAAFRSAPLPLMSGAVS